MPAYRRLPFGLVLSSCLAFGSTADAQTVIDSFAPSTLTIPASFASPISFLAVGSGLDRNLISSAYLVALPLGVAPPIQLQLGSWTPAQTQVQLTIPAASLPSMQAPSYEVMLFGSAPWPPMALADISYLPPVPIAAAIVPTATTNGATTNVVLTGQALDHVTTVYLERADSIVRCELTGAQSATSLTFQVPKGAQPGAYNVHAVSDDSVSYSRTGTPVITIGTAPNNPVEVTNLAPTIGINNSSVTVRLQVPGFGSLGNPSFLLTHPSGASIPVLHTPTGSPDLVDIVIPAGTPPRLYDIEVASGSHAQARSRAKFLVLGTALTDYFGDGTAYAFGAAGTVFYNGGSWGAVVEYGHLRYLYDIVGARVLLSDDGTADLPVGMLYDNGRFATADAASLGSISPNAATHSLEFHFRGQFGDTYSVSWGMEFPSRAALTLRSAYSQPFADGINTVYLGSLGVGAGYRHLAANFSGIAMDDNYLVGTRRSWLGDGRGSSVPYQGGADSPVCFLEDPNGGGVLVDATALRGSFDLQIHHRPSDIPLRSLIGFGVPAGAGNVHSGRIGPIRVVPSSGTWVSAVEPLESQVSNPHQPTWFNTLNHVTVPMGMHQPLGVYQPLSAADILAPFIAVADPRVNQFSDWKMVQPHAAYIETPDQLPTWTPSPLFTSVCSGLQTGSGFKIVPYFPTPGLGSSYAGPLAAVFRSHVLQSWDINSMVLLDRFWDLNGDGQLTLGEDYWPVSLSDGAFRTETINQIVAGRAGSMPFDGIYLDFLNGNTPMGDRNPSNGSAQAGFASLCSGLRSAFGNNFALATEGQSDMFASNGISFQTLYVNEGKTVARDPAGVITNCPMTNFHPIGAYLLRRSTKGYPSWDMTASSTRQSPLALSELAGYFHDALPTMAMYSDAGNISSRHDPVAVRAMTQSVEEGLYRRLKGVSMVTDIDPLWSSPNVACVYWENGVKIARTKTWVTKKLICDFYWWFGGRAPTAAELSAQLLRTDSNAISIYAAMTDVRDFFRVSPGVPVGRAAFRTNVLLAMPDYPLP